PISQSHQIAYSTTVVTPVRSGPFSVIWRGNEGDGPSARKTVYPTACGKNGSYVSNIKRGAARAARERSSPLGSAVSKWSTVGSVIICILAQRALSYAGESVRVNYKSGSGLERNIASERRQACGSSLGRTRKCMKDWMAALSAHLRTTRRRYPNDRLMVLFDVDGTILDMRYMVYHTLQAYDAAHGTHFFDKLQPTDITVHEDHVTRLLADLNIAPEDQPAIIDWYK